MTVEIKSPFSEFAGVMQFRNYYMATHVQKNKNTFISTKPETNLRVAQTAANLFAKKNQVPYCKEVIEQSKAIITVLEHDNNYIPAALHPNQIIVLTTLNPLLEENQKPSDEVPRLISLDEQEAIRMARMIASSKKLDCIPSLGPLLKNWFLDENLRVIMLTEPKIIRKMPLYKIT